MKTRHLTFVCLLFGLFLLLSSPFVFSSHFLGNGEYIIKVFIIILLLPDVLSSSYISKRTTFIIFFVFFYLVFHILLHPDLLTPVFVFFFNTFFFVEFLIISEKNKLLRLNVVRLIDLFAVFSAVMIIISFIFYNIIPSVFSTTYNSNGDPYGYNLVLGIVTNDRGGRPCWYFAEPSYCGFFLGLNLFNIYKRNDLDRKKKKKLLVLYISAILCSASVAAIIYVSVCTIIYFVYKLFKCGKLIEIVVSVGVLVTCLYISKIDAFQLMQASEELQTTSYNTRTTRMRIAEEEIAKMGFQDYLFGVGMESITIKHQIGVSDVYHKTFCENGLLFLVLYLLLIRGFLKGNIVAYSYTLLSFLSVILHLSPLMLISFFSIESISKYEYSGRPIDVPYKNISG